MLAKKKSNTTHNTQHTTHNRTQYKQTNKQNIENIVLSRQSDGGVQPKLIDFGDALIVNPENTYDFWGKKIFLSFFFSF